MILLHHYKTMLQDIGCALALQPSRLNRTAHKAKLYTVSVIFLSLENVFEFSLNTMCLEQQLLVSSFIVLNQDFMMKTFKHIAKEWIHYKQWVSIYRLSLYMALIVFNSHFVFALLQICPSLYPHQGIYILKNVFWS